MTIKNAGELDSSSLQNKLISCGEVVYFDVSADGDCFSNPFEHIAGKLSVLGFAHAPISFSYLLSHSNNYLDSPSFYGKKDIGRDLKALIAGDKDVLCFELPVFLSGKHLLFAVTVFYEKLKTAFIVVLRRLRKTEAAIENYYLRSKRDFTTGLLNKASCLEAINNTKLDGKTFVLFMDLNNFKLVNDVYGHVVGDTILKHFSDVLTNNAPKHFDSYRFGGDEFVVIARGSSEAEVTAFLKAAGEDFSESVPQNTAMSFSAGAVRSLPCLKNPLFLIRCSDKAMYFAKKNKVPYYLLSSKEVKEIMKEETLASD